MPKTKVHDLVNLDTLMTETKRQAHRERRQTDAAIFMTKVNTHIHLHNTNMHACAHTSKQMRTRIHTHTHKQKTDRWANSLWKKLDVFVPHQINRVHQVLAFCPHHGCPILHQCHVLKVEQRTNMYKTTPCR